MNDDGAIFVILRKASKVNAYYTEGKLGSLIAADLNDNDRFM